MFIKLDCGLAHIAVAKWQIVKSGLNPSNNSNQDIPRVSEYRLATHLTMAFVLYMVYLLTGFCYIFPPHDVRFTSFKIGYLG